MKKIISAILILAVLAALASCSLVRKISDDTKDPAESAADSESYATDFSETEAGDEGSTSVRYSEDDAYELLSHSFPDYDAENVKIERTGAIVAENDGTEYYVYNVALPKKVETKEPETDENGETVEDTTEIEMEPPVPYYVSVNGVVHTEIADANVDTEYAKNAFNTKYGQTNASTGFAYKLVYEGLLKSGETQCYSFAVYEVDNTGETPRDVYDFNYLVTLDGKMSAETKIDH